MLLEQPFVFTPELLDLIHEHLLSLMPGFGLRYELGSRLAADRTSRRSTVATVGVLRILTLIRCGQHCGHLAGMCLFERHDVLAMILFHTTHLPFGGETLALEHTA